MIKIEVYQLLDSVVCAINWYDADAAAREARAQQWVSLAYVKSEPLAHDETAMLVDLVTEALQTAEQAASERGGWSILT